MKETEDCELLLRAKALAVKKGLDDSKVECPFIDVCKGRRCYMFDVHDTFEENRLVAEDLKKHEGK